LIRCRGSAERSIRDDRTGTGEAGAEDPLLVHPGRSPICSLVSDSAKALPPPPLDWHAEMAVSELPVLVAWALSVVHEAFFWRALLHWERWASVELPE